MDLLHEVERVGWVPEMRGRDGGRRLDVMAQTLRIGSSLAASGIDVAIERGPLELLSREVASCVTPHGALPFDRSTPRPQYNTWTAMFAEQSLASAQAAGSMHSAVPPGPLLV